jgi:hypothetical protein
LRGFMREEEPDLRTTEASHARSQMMTTTTSSSTRVNPRRKRRSGKLTIVFII